MTYIQCLLISIAQGLTEFLPVSSSAHIVIVNALYKFFTHKTLSGDSLEEIFFAIIIHLGTLIAVLLYFKNDIIKIIKDFFSIFKTKNIGNEDQKLSLYIILGTVVTVVFCFPSFVFSIFIQSPSDERLVEKHHQRHRNDTEEHGHDVYHTGISRILPVDL